MWEKIIELKYLTVAKYYFLGILLAVIVFQFATKSMQSMELDFSSLIEKETLKYIVSALVGGLVGGLVFVIMMLNKNDRQMEERDRIKLKGSYKHLFIRNIVAFSIGGFVSLLIRNLFDLTSYENLLQSLFSKGFVISYFGMVLAMVVFSVLLSVGIKKRLNLIYDK